MKRYTDYLSKSSSFCVDKRHLIFYETVMEVFPMDFKHCSCTGRSLPRLIQPAIMAILAREPSHGYRIMEVLAEERLCQNPPPDQAGVYRLLKDMERNGYVEIRRDDHPSGGPARRKFALTEKGVLCLRTWLDTLREYQNSVAELAAFLEESLRLP
ncbi:MAG: PadR family transcriptional regulator [Desulfovibrio sp.]|jgi:DNA-binding PadR family transcriptional regulator|nr:PadR family transcriptional regulator [Desulfovibrio sp.]